MHALLADKWSRILPELRAKVGTAVFDAWLANLRPLALERGVFHLEAPNRLASEHVERLYRQVIADLLSAEFGVALSVDVEPAPTSLMPDQLEVGPTRPLVDASNQTAFLVLRALLEKRELPSPLFLFHGPPGCGKTFLLQWWRTRRRGELMHFDGLGLVHAFQAAIREQRTPALRHELARDRALILDEVHRVAGHARVQRELAQVIEARARGSAPTLIASRWHPREIRAIEPGLETWLLAGFVARIDWPGHGARLQYLRALDGPASRNGRADVVERLARDVQGGYPSLRHAWAMSRRASPGQRERYFKLIEPRSAFERLRDRVAREFGVEVEDLVGATQQRRASQARKVLAWLCVREGLRQAEIGRYLGRTRAAISYAVKALDAEIASDDALRIRLDQLS